MNELLYKTIVDPLTGQIRIYFNFIFYKTHDNRISRFPPTDTEYKVLITDLKLYEEVRANGLLYSIEHTGRNVSVIIDERKAPGA